MMSEFFSVDPSWCSTGCCVLMATAVCFLCDTPVTVSLGDGHRAAFTGTGQLLPLLGLGLGRKTAALTGSEGEPWELSLTSALHRVRPQVGPGMRFAGGPLDPRRSTTLVLSLRGDVLWSLPWVTVRMHCFPPCDFVSCRTWLEMGMEADLGCGFDR